MSTAAPASRCVYYCSLFIPIFRPLPPDEGHLDNGIPVSEMENNGLYEQPVVPESKPSHVLTVLNDTYKMEDEGAAYEQPIFHTQPNVSPSPPPLTSGPSPSDQRPLPL